MRKSKYYTLILSGSGGGSVRRICFKADVLKALAGGALFLVACGIFLVSDYFLSVSYQTGLHKALEEKSRLKKQLFLVEERADSLTKEVFQLRDFHRKIKNMTALRSGSAYGKTGMPPSSEWDHPSEGEFSAQASAEAEPAGSADATASADAALATLAGAANPPLSSKSSPVPSKTAPSREPAQEDGRRRQKAGDGGGKVLQLHPPLTPPKNHDGFQELVVRIDRATAKARLTRQDAWNIYSSLLKNRELLERTPSILPVRGWITSPFGYRNETFYADHDLRFHRGIDIAADMGSPVLSAAAGQTLHTGYDDSGYGKTVVIDHGYHVRTVYAHLSEIKVQRGAYVRRGDLVGLVGNTGKSTGPHLHYEVQIFGTPVNPANYILDLPLQPATGDGLGLGPGGPNLGGPNLAGSRLGGPHHGGPHHGGPHR